MLLLLLLGAPSLACCVDGRWLLAAFQLRPRWRRACIRGRVPTAGNVPPSFACLLRPRWRGHVGSWCVTAGSMRHACGRSGCCRTPLRREGDDGLCLNPPPSRKSGDGPSFALRSPGVSLLCPSPPMQWCAGGAVPCRAAGGSPVVLLTCLPISLAWGRLLPARCAPVAPHLYHSVLATQVIRMYCCYVPLCSWLATHTQPHVSSTTTTPPPSTSLFFFELSTAFSIPCSRAVRRLFGTRMHARV